MRSTGEVMGVGENFGEAFAKAQLARERRCPMKGTVFISVNDRDKPAARRSGSEVSRARIRTGRDARHRRRAQGRRAAGEDRLQGERRPSQRGRLAEGRLAEAGDLHHHGRHSFTDEQTIRRNAVTYRVPCITTMSGAKAAAEAVVARRRDPIRVWSLQELHADRVVQAVEA